MTFRQKNLLLLAGSVVFSIITYFISIRPTFSLYQENKELEGQLELVNKAPVTINQLSEEVNYYKQILKSFTYTSNGQEAVLLDRVTSACRQYQITLAALPPAQVSLHKDLEIETREVKVRGNFIHILQAIYALEFTYQVGRLSSVRFLLEEDRKNKKTYLFATIYIQNLRVNSHAR